MKKLIIFLIFLMILPVTASVDLSLPGNIMIYNSSGLQRVVWFNDTQQSTSSGTFALITDIPFMIDFYNNGSYYLAAYRPSNGNIYVDLNRNGVWNGAVEDYTRSLGTTGGISVMIGNVRSEEMSIVQETYLLLIAIFVGIIAAIRIYFFIRQEKVL